MNGKIIIHFKRKRVVIQRKKGLQYTKREEPGLIFITCHTNQLHTLALIFHGICLFTEHISAKMNRMMVNWIGGYVAGYR